MDLGDQALHEPTPPRRPRRRAGGAGVGLGEGRQQVEERFRLHDLGDVGRSGRILDVAPRGDVRQQEVPAHEPADRASVRLREPPAPRDVDGHGVTHLAVVAGSPLPDVVQQGADGQQVGPVDAADDLSRLHAGLDAVPVDGVAVHRRRRAPQPDVDPLGEPVVDDAGVVELVPHRHQARTGREQVDDRAGGARRPRLRQLAERFRQVSGGVRSERESGLSRHRRSTQGDLRVVARVGIAHDDDLVVELPDPLRQRRDRGPRGRHRRLVVVGRDSSTSSTLRQASAARCARRRPMLRVSSSSSSGGRSRNRATSTMWSGSSFSNRRPDTSCRASRTSSRAERRPSVSACGTSTSHVATSARIITPSRSPPPDSLRSGTAEWASQPDRAMRASRDSRTSARRRRASRRQSVSTSERSASTSPASPATVRASSIPVAAR